MTPRVTESQRILIDVDLKKMQVIVFYFLAARQADVNEQVGKSFGCSRCCCFYRTRCFFVINGTIKTQTGCNSLQGVELAPNVKIPAPFR